MNAEANQDRPKPSFDELVARARAAINRLRSRRHTYAIADLHGRFDLLTQALSIIEDHAGSAGGTLVIMGDMVDRGPDSRSIIDLLIAGPTLPNWRWIVLKGNHEEMMSVSCRGLSEPKWWLKSGGDATIASYGVKRRELFSLPAPLDRHLAWIDTLPLSHVDEQRIFVHAGLDHGLPLQAQTSDVMLWKRYSPEEVGDFWGKHVVHGHDQSRHGPVLHSGRTNLDTFAWNTGRLAIGVFNDALPGSPIGLLWAVGEPAKQKRSLFSSSGAP